MPRKTVEERIREYDDAKAKRTKVYVNNGVVVPETYDLRQKRHYRFQRQRDFSAEKTIYGLVDPMLMELFYIGSTKNLSNRLYKHRELNNNARTKELQQRIEQILRTGFKPQIVVLERTSIAQRESDWIQFFSKQGIDLLNKNLSSNLD